MLELPGMTTSGDARQDVQKILRYLSKLVPQLEMELANAQQDGYTGAMNALSQGVGVVNKNTTAGALAAHELRKDNPHGVTAAQLGLTLDKLLAVELKNSGMTARIGEKRGLQMNVQEKTVNISQWTQKGGVAWADADLGDWATPFQVLYYTGLTADGSGDMEVWAGPVLGGSRERIGTVRIYRTCDIEVAEGSTNSREIEELKVVKLMIMGLGVFGYGEQ